MSAIELAKKVRAFNKRPDSPRTKPFELPSGRNPRGLKPETPIRTLPHGDPTKPIRTLPHGDPRPPKPIHGDPTKPIRTLPHGDPRPPKPIHGDPFVKDHDRTKTPPTFVKDHDRTKKKTGLDRAREVANKNSNIFSTQFKERKNKKPITFFTADGGMKVLNANNIVAKKTALKPKTSAIKVTQSSSRKISEKTPKVTQRKSRRTTNIRKKRQRQPQPELDIFGQRTDERFNLEEN